MDLKKKKKRLDLEKVDHVNSDLEKFIKYSRKIRKPVSFKPSCAIGTKKGKKGYNRKDKSWMNEEY